MFNILRYWHIWNHLHSKNSVLWFVFVWGKWHWLYMLFQSGMLTFQITNQNTQLARRRKTRTLMRDLRVKTLLQTHHSHILPNTRERVIFSMQHNEYHSWHGWYLKPCGVLIRDVLLFFCVMLFTASTCRTTKFVKTCPFHKRLELIGLGQNYKRGTVLKHI